MSLDFTAIDFETANPKRASACAVGLVRVRGGRIADEKDTLIQPPAGFAEFSAWNMRVHGITPAMVRSAPPWRQVAAWIEQYVGDDLLVAGQGHHRLVVAVTVEERRPFHARELEVGSLGL